MDHTHRGPVADAGAGGRGMSETQVQVYRRQGICFPFTAMSAGQASGYRARLEAFEQQYGSRGSEILRQKSHLALTFVDELIRLEPVLDKVQSLLGPDILCWSTSFFIKNPGDGKFISWHQDAQYWGLEADDVVTAWIALTPSTPETGCMRVVPESHTRIVEHNDTRAENNMLTRGQEVAVEVDERTAWDVTLMPGEFSLHHERIIHGSRPNRGGDRRIGLAVRYVKPSARQVRESSDSAMLVRGADVHGHFLPEPRPRADMDPAAVGFLDDLLSKRAGGAYRTGS